MNATRFLALSALVLAAAAARLIPHPWNVSPVAAMALFAGAQYGSRSVALAVPLAAMLLSDALLGFHSTMPFVYGALALTVLLGRRLRIQSVDGRLIGASLASSVLFFLVTNAGVWLMEGLYPLTANGLWACYAAGIPFFRWTLLGDLAYSAVFFGALQLACRAFPRLHPGPAAA